MPKSKLVRNRLAFGMQLCSKFVTWFFFFWSSEPAFRAEFRSVQAVLMDAYPDHHWQPWLFSRVLKNPQAESNAAAKENGPIGGQNTQAREYLDWMFNLLKLKGVDDWYSVTYNHFVANGGPFCFRQVLFFLGGFYWLKLLQGAHVLKQYGDIPTLLEKVYPEHSWDVMKFKILPNFWWAKVDNQRRYFQWLRRHLPGGETEGNEVFYAVSKKILRQYRGHLLLREYNFSPSLAVMSAFPEHKWKAWLFNATPQNYWQDINNWRSYCDWFAMKHGLKDLNDWYKVTSKQITANKGNRIKHDYRFLNTNEWIVCLLLDV